MCYIEHTNGIIINQRTMDKEINNKKKYINIYIWFFIIYCLFSLFCMLFIISIINEETLKYPAWISDIKIAACLDIVPPILIFILNYFAKKFNWKLAVNIIVNLLFLPAALITYLLVITLANAYYWIMLEPY